MLALFTSGCGEGDDNSNDKTLLSDSSIYGTWDRPEFNMGQFTFRNSLTFEKEKVTATVKCSKVNEYVETSVSSRMEITDSQISILDDVRTPENENKMGCSAILRQEQIAYKLIDADTLSMTRKNDTPTTLKRRKR